MKKNLQIFINAVFKGDARVLKPPILKWVLFFSVNLELQELGKVLPFVSMERLSTVL